MKLLLLCFLATIGFQQPKNQTKPAFTEDQKIEYLIKSIAALDASFIRNGDGHTPKEAAEHLRMKRNKAGKSIKTAKQFIDQIASKSSMSGEAYRIKYKDGKSETSAAFLNRKLNEVEAK